MVNLLLSFKRKTLKTSKIQLLVLLFFFALINPVTAQKICFNKMSEFKETNKHRFAPSVAELEMVDINKDNQLDAITVINNKIQIWLQHENAFFESAQIDSKAPYDSYFVIEDFNNDGYLDIGTAAWEIPGMVRIYINDGFLNFTMQVIDSDYLCPTRIYSGDMDLDGDMDLVVSAEVPFGFGYFRLAWFENDGHANFTKHSIVVEFNGAIDIKLVDLDQDGDLDILYGNHEGFLFCWYRNNGDKSFTEVGIDVENEILYRITAHDIDQNGFPDILLAMANPEELFILLNDGSGTYEKVLLCDFEHNYGSCQVSDLDGDGDMDISTACYSKVNDFIWFENDGSLNFTMRIVTPSYSYVTKHVPCDINDDGKLDLVAGNGRGGLAWWSNQPNFGADLFMPSHHVVPGSPCSLTAHVFNDTSASYNELPLFIFMEYAGNIWFYPDWGSELTYQLVKPPVSDVNYRIIDPFSWPEGCGSGDGLVFMSFFTEPELANIYGSLGYWEFSWSE